MDRTIRLNRRVDSQWTFQPIGENGEPQAFSEPYVSESNAKRGAHDLFPEDELTFQNSSEGTS